MVNHRTRAPLRITERIDYAVRSVVLLAQNDPAFVTARTVAEHYGMSLKLVGGVMWSLSAAGIVGSRPGWHGGFRLARRADQISLRSVITAAAGAEPPPPSSPAPMGPANGRAPDRDIVAGFWAALDRSVQEALEVLTIADLIGDAPEHSWEFHAVAQLQLPEA